MMCIYAWYKEEEKDDAKKREREEETQGAAHASSSSSLSVICHSPTTITIINPHIIISITSSSPSITSHHTRSMIFLRKRSTQQHTAPCSTAQHHAAPRSTTQHTTLYAIRYTQHATRNTQLAARNTQHAARSTRKCAQPLSPISSSCFILSSHHIYR